MTPRRKPPHDEGTERSLLGVCMVSRDAIDTALAHNLEPADFYSTQHQAIFSTVLRLFAANDPVDHVTVAAALNGDLGDRGPELVKAMFLEAPASANAGTYARLIKVHSRLRKTYTIAGHVQETILEGGDPTLFLDELQAPDSGTGTSWAEIDIAEILAGDLQPPQPDLFARDDGRKFLYAGVVHTFVGESESLKSWLALLATAQEIAAGNDVLYLDFEDTAHSILGRLRSLGARADDLEAGFHYLRPEEPLDAAGIRRLDQLCERSEPTLAVIDGVTEAMALEGLDLLDNTDVARWQARLPRRLSNLGPAVVLIDHVPKSTENRGRYAIGAQHKLAGIYVSYVIDPIHPMAHVPEGTLDPITGVSKITVAKDRYGAVRGFAAGRKHVGELHLTAWPDGGVTGHLIPAVELPEGGFKPTIVMKRITSALAKAGTPLSKNAIRAAVKGKHDVIDLALELLTHEGFIARESGPRNAQLHRLIHEYEDTDQKEESDHAPQPKLDGDAF